MLELIKWNFTFLGQVRNNTKLYSSISLWTERWFLSTNAKDIGLLYLMFAIFTALLATGFSILMRIELSGPGVQYIADNQLYNTIVTAHGVLMMFFCGYTCFSRWFWYFSSTFNGRGSWYGISKT